MSRKLLFVFVLTAAILSGCNTMAGFGQDMSSAGHAITHAADH